MTFIKKQNWRPEFGKLIIIILFLTMIKLLVACGLILKSEQPLNDGNRDKNNLTKDRKNSGKVNVESYNPNVIQQLEAIKDVEKFMEAIAHLNTMGKIAYGDRVDFEITKDSNIFIIIIDEKKVYNILKFPNQKIGVNKIDQIISDLLKPFNGKRQIWIQCFDK